MPPDATKFQGNWKGLFVCPNAKITRDLTPLLSRLLPGFASHEVDGYPSRHQVGEVLASATPSFCLLEISEPVEQGLGTIQDLLRVDPKLPIIALLPKNDAQLGLRCLRQGASDFLIQPFTSEQVEAALHKITKLQPGRFKNPGKVYCIMPAKGGCGASTLASSFSHQLRRLPEKRILLADLDPLTGTQSFLLKIKSSYSFLDVLAHSHEIDGDLWKAMVTSRQGMDILLAPEMLSEGVGDITNPSGIIEYARGAYDMVVLDAGGVYGEWNVALAQMANEILLVTTNELTSLQAVQRALTYLEANNVGHHKVRLIVNRYDRHMGLGKDVIGTALHTEIYHLIPADYEPIQKALMEGKPLGPSTNFGKSVSVLGGPADGRRRTKQEEQQSSSSLSSLLSLFSRTSS